VERMSGASCKAIDQSCQDLARNRNPLESASAAAFVNGLAGKLVQRKLGLHMAASDLVDVLPSVLKPFDRIK